jgi:hypothetical protein
VLKFDGLGVLKPSHSGLIFAERSRQKQLEALKDSEVSLELIPFGPLLSAFHFVMLCCIVEKDYINRK